MRGPDNAFIVDMPGEPVYKLIDTVSPGGTKFVYHSYSLDYRRLSFVAQTALYPADVDVSQPKLNLQSVLDDRAQRLAGTKWTKIDWRERLRRPGRRIDRLGRGRQCAAPARAAEGPALRVARLPGAGRGAAHARGRAFLQVVEVGGMSKPRIHILALGGTIATRPDASGAMQMGLGADDLVAAVPLLGSLAEIEAETVSRVGSHSLSFDQIHELAAKIRSLKADGVVVTQGTDTLEETGFLLDLLLDLDIPVIVTAAMRNPALTSPDGPGNLLAAVRVACDPWVRAHAKALGVIAVMLDEVYAAADVLKVHPTRLNAFASPQTGPLAALVEDRIVPMSLPVRDAIEAARSKIGTLASGAAQPIALLWMGLDEPGRLIEAMLAAPDRLGYRGAVLAAMGGGHTPERMADIAVRLAAAMPTVVSPRAGGGPMLRQTYGGPSSEIALRKAGLIWGGRLHPLKARVLLETCLRAGLDRDIDCRSVRRLRLECRESQVRLAGAR